MASPRDSQLTPLLKRGGRTLIGLYRPDQVPADRIAANVLNHFGVEPIDPPGSTESPSRSR